MPPTRQGEGARVVAHTYPYTHDHRAPPRHPRMDQPLRSMATQDQPSRRLDLPPLPAHHPAARPCSLATRPPPRHDHRPNPAQHPRTRTRALQHLSRRHSRQPLPHRHHGAHMGTLISLHATPLTTAVFVGTKQDMEDPGRSDISTTRGFASVVESETDALCGIPTTRGVAGGGACDGVVRSAEAGAWGDAGGAGADGGCLVGFEPDHGGDGAFCGGSGGFVEEGAGSAVVVVCFGAVDGDLGSVGVGAA